MAIAEITAALTGIKAAKNLVKSFSSLSSEVEIKSKSSELLNIIVGLQEQILSMQSKHGELLQSKNELEKQLVNIESWEKEKAQYELKEICPGVFVYASKQDNNSTQPSHWLCTNCYNNEKKSILQYDSFVSDGTHYLCPNCKNEICKTSKKNTSLTDYNPHSSGGSNSWMGA